jgi:hypothetical protein
MLFDHQRLFKLSQKKYGIFHEAEMVHVVILNLIVVPSE